MTDRTLRIDSVRVPVGGGLIGMCACPGGRRYFAVHRDPAADLDADLNAIRDWGAEALVSLVETAELEMLGLGTLPQRAADLGLRWTHLPIPDMCEPGSDFLRRWQHAGPGLRRVLANEGRIVLHCWAGLGRTGTVAACLLVEFGMDPRKAMCRVREARPGAIQSLQQEIHVMRQTPLPRPGGT